MKHTLYIISLVLVFASCGSGRQSQNYQLDEKTNETKTIESAETVQTVQASYVTSEKSANTNIKGFSRITNYNDSGGISSVQETWWDSRSDELESGTGGSSSLSVGESKINETETSETEKKGELNTKSEKDNRVVQGFEWVYIIISVGVVLFVTATIIIYKYKKKK